MTTNEVLDGSITRARAALRSAKAHGQRACDVLSDPALADAIECAANMASDCPEHAAGIAEEIAELARNLERISSMLKRAASLASQAADFEG